MTTYEEALKQSVDYFNGDSLAAEVYLGKYALTTPEGDVLEPTPKDMHKRLAKEFARIEKKYPNAMSEEEIFNLLDRFKYIIPQGSPMSGVGNKYYIQSLGNCFVLAPPLDSFGGILKTDQELVQLAKRRCGIGFSISNIRPRGLPTNNAAKTTDGISVFMERFSNSTREVAQNGRRGALLMSLSVHHPEIETFINIKKDRKKVTGANISVELTDEFLTAVKKDEEYEQRWPVNSDKPKIIRKVKAKLIWNQIIAGAWDCAEPGVLFIDTIQKNSPADCYAKKDIRFLTTSTNPCGEIPMGSDSCRLTLLNSYSYVEQPFTKKAEFNWELFAKHIIAGQKLMDDIVDLELECINRIIQKIDSDPEPKNVKQTERDMWKNFQETCLLGRRTGLGLTGIGDTLAALNIRYGSKKSIEVIDKIYRTLYLESYRSSILMAKDRGFFPLFEHKLEKNHTFIERLRTEDSGLYKLYTKYGRRNVANLTTAPAGSVSILTQTTSGIEPAFQLKYKRRKKINPSDKNAKVDFIDDLGDKWQEYTVYHHGFNKWMEIADKTEKEIEDSPYWKSTSGDIDWSAGIDLQGAAQNWIDHAISRTINLPLTVSKETVGELYFKAWQAGLKGFTIYREGSRSGVLVGEDTGNKEDANKIKFTINHAPKRPEDLNCDVYHMTVKGERWNIFVGLYEDKPYEVFAGRSSFIDIPKSCKKGIIKKKNGQYNLHIGLESQDSEMVIKDLSTVFENPTEGAFTRTISLALRHGTPVQYVVEQIEKGADKDSDMFSLGKGLARTLKNHIKDGTKSSLKKCPQCDGVDLAYQEGCVACKACGYSKCG